MSNRDQAGALRWVMLSLAWLTVGCEIPTARECSPASDQCPPGTYCHPERHYCVTIPEGGIPPGADAAADASAIEVDGSGRDSATADLVTRDAAGSDLSSADTSSFDSAPSDIASFDTPGADALEVDATAADTLAADAQVADIVGADASAGDAAQTDTRLPDASAQDTAAADASQPDTLLPDTSIPDTSVPDTSLPDLNLPDSSGPDAWTPLPSDRQAGSASFAGTDTELRFALAPTVDESSSVLFFNITTDSIAPADGHVAGEIVAGGAEVRFLRDSANTGVTLDLEWSVLELDGVSVQRGVVSPGDALTGQAALNQVDLGRSFAFHSMHQGGGNYNGDDWYRVSFGSDQLLDLTRVIGCCNSVVYWQVVELTAAPANAVRSGLVTLADTALTVSDAIGATVDRGHSFLIFSYQIADGGGVQPLAPHLLRGRISSGGDQVIFDRMNGAGAADIAWFVVTWDALRAVHGELSFADGEADQNAAISPAVDPARSVSFCPAYQKGGSGAYTADDPIGAGWFTSALNAGGDQITLHRGDPTGAAAVDWTVIEF